MESDKYVHPLLVIGEFNLENKDAVLILLKKKSIHSQELVINNGELYHQCPIL